MKCGAGAFSSVCMNIKPFPHYLAISKMRQKFSAWPSNWKTHRDKEWPRSAYVTQFLAERQTCGHTGVLLKYQQEHLVGHQQARQGGAGACGSAEGGEQRLQRGPEPAGGRGHHPVAGHRHGQQLPRRLVRAGRKGEPGWGSKSPTPLHTIENLFSFICSFSFSLFGTPRI